MHLFFYYGSVSELSLQCFPLLKEISKTHFGYNRFLYLRRELSMVWRFRKVQLRPRTLVCLHTHLSFKAVFTVRLKVPSIQWRVIHMFSLSSDFVEDETFLEH